MMIRKFFATALILSTAISLSACGRAQLPTASYTTLPRTVKAQAQNAPVQLIVRFRPDASRMAMQSFNQKYQLQTVSYIANLNAYVMTLRNPVSSQAALKSMVSSMQQEGVATLVEVNHEMQAGPVTGEMYISPIISR